jgi:hypothetical protein
VTRQSQYGRRRGGFDRVASEDYVRRTGGSIDHPTGNDRLAAELAAVFYQDAGAQTALGVKSQRGLLCCPAAIRLDRQLTQGYPPLLDAQMRERNLSLIS